MKLHLKNIFSIFLAVSFLLMFSCATNPETEEELPEIEVVETIGEDIKEAANIEETEEQVAEEILPSDFQEEITKAALNELPFEIAQQPVEGQPSPVQNLPSEEPIIQEQPQEQAQAAVPQDPPIQEQRPRLPPAPQTPPPSPPQQTPPVSPPAALGPAEEIPKERETFVPPRVEPERELPVAITAIPPTAAIVPQDGGEIIFSRIVRATVGQIIEIPFRGTGWVYLGELASRRGIAYDSRRLDPEGQSFIFKAEEAGTYALKFYKQDFIRDYILNDHVQVIVGEAPGGSAGWFNPPRDLGRVVAEPRWPSALEEAQIQRGSLFTPGSRPAADRTPEETPSVISAQRDAPAQVTPSQQARAQPPVTENQPRGNQTPERQPAVERPQNIDSPPPFDRSQAEERQTIETPQNGVEKKLSPEELIDRAKETFDGGNAAAAIALLDQYAEYFPSGTDELYWYYGQFYEANTPSRNILLSLDYYRRLVNEYPQSSRYNDARRRIAYLERFYINIQ